MKIKRILRVHFMALLIVAATSLAGCMQWDAEFNRPGGVDVIPVVGTSHIAINSVNAGDYQVTA